MKATVNAGHIQVEFHCYMSELMAMMEFCKFVRTEGDPGTKLYKDALAVHNRMERALMEAQKCLQIVSAPPLDTTE